MNNQIQSVIVVGSGNVAESVAVAVSECPTLELRQVVARNTKRASEVAALAHCPWCDDMAKAAAADLYIIAVSDRAVEDVATALRRAEGSIVVHTAGSVERSVLGEEHTGVLYPFQTFTVGRRVDFSAVPLFVEGSDEQTTQQIECVAHALSRRVYRATSAVRREVHSRVCWRATSSMHSIRWLPTAWKRMPRYPSMCCDRLSRRLPARLWRPRIPVGCRQAPP
ncbi:MAG: NAD(P)-binding domain-containing protein [Alistipes sp.]|nr:NAD(P)-binding domain-containing protein [Alistipes sp.]